MKLCEEGELYREEPVELAEIIEEQLASSSENLGEIEADPDKVFTVKLVKTRNSAFLIKQIQ